MTCPHFKEGYFGLCDAPDAIHVPTIDEMERFCFKACYADCPSLSRRVRSAPRIGRLQRKERAFLRVS
jgi:hypothetical protein